MSPGISGVAPVKNALSKTASRSTFVPILSLKCHRPTVLPVTLNSDSPPQVKSTSAICASAIRGEQRTHMDCLRRGSRHQRGRDHGMVGTCMRALPPVAAKSESAAGFSPREVLEHIPANESPGVPVHCQPLGPETGGIAEQTLGNMLTEARQCTARVSAPAREPSQYEAHRAKPESQSQRSIRPCASSSA